MALQPEDRGLFTQNTMRFCIIVVALAAVQCLGAGHLRAQQPPACVPPPAGSAFDPANPNVGQLKLQLRYYKCSAYDADVAAKLAEARQWIDQRAGQVAKPVLVLDIDETSLSNWAQMSRNDFGFIPSGACDADTLSACGQRDWELSAAATVIQPTLDLFIAAKAKNVSVFFVTGRYEDPVERAATELNLTKAGYSGWDGLKLRPQSTRGSPVSDYKSSAREEIEKAGYTIIANVGDQESDLAKGHAEKTFKVPNPFYFIP